MQWLLRRMLKARRLSLSTGVQRDGAAAAHHLLRQGDSSSSLQHRDDGVDLHQAAGRQIKLLLRLSNTQSHLHFVPSEDARFGAAGGERRRVGRLRRRRHACAGQGAGAVGGLVPLVDGRRGEAAAANGTLISLLLKPPEHEPPPPPRFSTASASRRPRAPSASSWASSSSAGRPSSSGCRSRRCSSCTRRRSSTGESGRRGRHNHRW